MTDRPEPAVSAIVLAGGRSHRFGSDKLRARYGDGTLLDRAIAAVDGVATEVVVVVAPDDDRSPIRQSQPLRVVRDPEPFGGPLIGLLAGLESAAEPFVLVVAGDMPSLSPDVLRLMTRRLAAETTVDAVALAIRGALVPLPAIVRTGAATDVARQLIADGERRLRSIFDRLATRVLDDGEWRPLDPEAETLRDIDVPNDLTAGA